MPSSRTEERQRAKGSNIGDANYLFTIDRMYNSNAKGVIHFNGNVGVSGVLNGRITMYANGSIVLLDDLRYANDPVKGVCRDILGLISDKDIVIADNSLLDPQPVNGSGTLVMPDDSKDIDIHAVMMSLGSSFRVENYSTGPTSFNNCGTTVNGRGCINLSGGLIQKIRGAVGTSGGTGLREALLVRPLRHRESAAVLPHHRSLPRQPLPGARPGRLQSHGILPIPDATTLTL